MKDAQRIRRNKVLSALPSATDVLIAAGLPRVRNYAALTYPYRASSTFLFLVGQQIPGAYLLLKEGVDHLFVPTPEPDAELWSGEPESMNAIAQKTLCVVHPLSELPRYLNPATLTLPLPDCGSCQELSRYLNRDIVCNQISECDLPLAEAVIQTRLVQDEEGISEIRKALAITKMAFGKIMHETRAGMREEEAYALLESVFLAENTQAAYPSIVTVHGEILHSDRRSGVLQEGDLLLVDAGAESTGGWASDITRTWPVSKRFSATQKEIYNVVLESQRAAMLKCKPGVRYRDVHLTAAKKMTEGLVDLGILKGKPDELVERGIHAAFFPHGIGHLLGLDVHDMEDFGDRASYGTGRTRDPQFGLSYLRLDRELAPGMVVTIEPGFYRSPAIFKRFITEYREVFDLDVLAKFDDVRGIRIEDDILITATGHEVLSAGIARTVSSIEELRGG